MMTNLDAINKAVAETTKPLRKITEHFEALNRSVTAHLDQANQFCQAFLSEAQQSETNDER